MPLTIVLATDRTAVDESVDQYDELVVGQIIDGEDGLRLQVLAYYPYEPITLADALGGIALAIVHPVDEPVPPQEEWYVWQAQEFSPFTCWHVLMHNGEVLKLEEKPNGAAPEIGKPFFHYCTDGLIHEPPKLDRASLLQFMSTVHKRQTGLEHHSYRKYLHLDAPFKEIYVVELAPNAAIAA